MSSNEQDILAYVLPAVLILPALLMFCLMFCLCRGCCLGKCRACRATKLPPEEAEEIINAMQGDWDVTLTPGTCMCGCTSFERMTVSGRMVARIDSGSGQNRPMSLRPARASDGSIILDNFGSKAIVFTPEQGRMEIELMGWKCEWRRVGGNQTVPPQVDSSATGGIADQIQKLHDLREQGVLTEQEFSAAKNRLINPDQSSGGPSASYDRPPPYPADLEAGLPMKTY